MALDKFPKQPGETLDYDVSFVDWLAARQDAIASHTVDVPTGITLVDSVVNSGVLKVFLMGGTDGQTYKVTVTVTTVGSRVKEAEFLVQVKEL